jgi:tRNA(fMet)-specific endonuclease VapC
MLGVREALLDTSVLVAHIRNSLNLTDYAQEGVNWYLSVISQGELVQGVLTSSQAKINDARLRRLLSEMGILPVTEETAERYASIASQLAGRGATIPQNDMWIAACALEHDLPLATSDAHFQRVKDLQVLMW